MKQVLFFMMGLLVFSPAVNAKLDIQVARFKDQSQKGRCAAATEKAKADIELYLQNKLIAGLMQLNRFQIQEREVQKLSPQYTIVGNVRDFEVCSKQSRIALEVRLIHSKKGLTHVFSSSAQARNSEKAISAAINETLLRLDNALPRRDDTISLANKIEKEDSLRLELLPRDTR